MDGGTVWNLNLASAVKRCREQVDDDSQITIDIVVCHRGKMLEDWDFRGKFLENKLRYDEIKAYSMAEHEILGLMKAFPKVNFRYYVEPSGKLPGGISMITVDNSTVLWPAQEMGRKDGANAVKMGEGTSFEIFASRTGKSQNII